jgi:membrane-associated protein
LDLTPAFLDFFLHLDDHLAGLVDKYHTGIYLILFAIVFCETGLVVTPFLPGDSLLFAAGALAGSGRMELALLYLIFMSAALLGDNTNYFIGKFLGPRILRNENSRILNRKHLNKTHAFFEKYGGKTIIIARFVPIVRTFTPFVAGIGAMTYPRFLLFSIAGALLWVGSCVTLGYVFGGLPAVKNNFTLIVLAIVFISILPAIIEFLRHRRQHASTSIQSAELDRE